MVRLVMMSRRPRGVVRRTTVGRRVRPGGRFQFRRARGGPAWLTRNTRPMSIRSVRAIRRRMVPRAA